MKWVLAFSIVVLLADTAASIPASPFPYDALQPDGTIVTLMLNGDEFSNYESDLKGKLGGGRFCGIIP
jgi:hypothetical protein